MALLKIGAQVTHFRDEDGVFQTYYEALIEQLEAICQEGMAILNYID